MHEFFRGWKRKAAFIAAAIALYAICMRIRRAIAELDHSILGPLFGLSMFMIFMAPIIGLEVGAAFSQPGKRLGPLVFGFICGIVVSYLCLNAAGYLAGCIA